jgi:glycosyltransferase involved in cell wall biosynthesis
MKTVVVIPCFNEARRLDLRALDALRDAGSTPLVVDDGSTDDTVARVVAAGHGVLPAPHLGKAEAVRAGLVAAIADGADVVGYLDADFSTPAAEWLRLRDELLHDQTLVFVMGSRIAHLGATIERRPARHYLGRIFATAASLTLSLPVYDTQCGAKVMRVNANLQAALMTPFQSTWAFDVELLQRLLGAGVAHSAIREVPLKTWRDVDGGHLNPLAMARAVVELWRLRRR